MAKSGQGWHIQPKGSIQAKLLRSFAFQSAAVLALAFVSIMVLDWRRANLQLTEMENNIRAGLDAKGQNLSRNLSLVIRSLMEDNAIASIREIVDSLANQDSDIAYAAFMDAESRPWAFRSKVEYGRKADMREILSDSISIWASTSSMARSLKWRAAEGEIIEFAAPVYSGSESRGVVRVGLDTRSMRAALKEATEQVWQNRILTLGVFFAAAFSAFLLSLALSRLQAGRFTRPVLDLAASAKRIAGGDYSGEFSVRGEGEFALLAQVFETMRGKIQAYTHRLESLVAEKVRQIGDLLENVDQGLFTFNQDLNVNPDHSARAATVLRQENLAGRNLEEVLRMTPIQAGQFRDWVDVVFRDHARRRWSKLVMLAPMREMTLATEAGTQIIALDYRKILDADGRLGKIMVLAQDVTEKRALEMRLAEEKVRHESKVRIILGVAGNAEEMIAAFLLDSVKRLGRVREALRMENPDWRRHVFFDCHTLKGNAAGFGFEALALAAQSLEAHLQAFGQGEPDPSILIAIEESLRRIEEERNRIEEVYRMLSGSLERPPIRMDPDKVEMLQALAERARRTGDPKDLGKLMDICGSIRHRSLASLALKYRELLHRAAGMLGKEVEFRILSPDVELDPALILMVDEALVHIFRNCLAHGIETPEIRARQGKAKGRIEFSYSHTEKEHTFTVRDDGRGIDGEALAKRAVAMGLITDQEASRLDAEAKVQLVFMPGLSTASAVDTLSGQGQGMAIVLQKVRSMAGNLTVETRPAAGTCFSMTFPDSIPEATPGRALEKALTVAT